MLQAVRPEPHTPRVTTPPLAGLPSAIHGHPIAWARPGGVKRHECVCCGQPQAVDRDVSAVLCGRCALLLSDAYADMPRPRGTPEDVQRVNRRRFREQRRRGAPRKHRLAY
jgi:hypothetical protein